MASGWCETRVEIDKVEATGEALKPLYVSMGRTVAEYPHLDAWTLDKLVTALGKTEGFMDKLEALAVRYPHLLEYIHVKLWFRCIPRFVADQLARHRLASWMMTSVRHGRLDLPLPDLLKKVRPGYWRVVVDWYRLSRGKALELIDKGVPVEVAARILPPVYAVDLYYAGNLRELLHILWARLQRDVQLETRVVAAMAARALVGHSPSLRAIVLNWFRVYRAWGWPG